MSFLRSAFPDRSEALAGLGLVLCALSALFFVVAL